MHFYLWRLLTSLALILFLFFYVQEFHAEEHEYHRRPSDIINYLGQGCTGTGCQTDRTTESCTVAPSICGPPLWNMLHVTLLAPRILRLHQNFWKM